MLLLTFLLELSVVVLVCMRGIEWHFYWHNLWLGEVASARQKMECLLNSRLLASRSSEGKASLHFFCSLSTLTFVTRGCVECVLMWVRDFLNRFTTVFVRFLTSSLLYNTILAYCLTWSHCFFRLLKRSINWLIENIFLCNMLHFIFSYSNSKKNIKTPLRPCRKIL